MAFILSDAVTVLIAIGILYSINRYFHWMQAGPLPPEPRGIPLLGSLNEMPKPGIIMCHHWLKNKDLYSPISSVTILGRTFIIINDPAIAFDLMRDRSATNSSRPVQTFSGRICHRYMLHNKHSCRDTDLFI